MEMERQFEAMGARVKIDVAAPRRHADLSSPAVLNIRHDKHGEHFHIERRSSVRLDVADLWTADRHLLLVVTDPRLPASERTTRFLCGHDERAWFVAAIPEETRAATVQDAMDALKPAEVWRSIERHQVSGADRNLRRNAAFVRQGEWFFIPVPTMEVRRSDIRQREPIQRGNGKPHLCDELFRRGGEKVWVHPSHPNGLTSKQYLALPERERATKRWTKRVRQAGVWVRGRIRHRDHATIRLDCWHQVVMNTETRAVAMRHVAFLD